jgi:hypothetical protein
MAPAVALATAGAVFNAQSDCLRHGFGYLSAVQVACTQVLFRIICKLLLTLYLC